MITAIKKSVDVVIEDWTKDNSLTPKEKVAIPCRTLSAKAGHGVVCLLWLNSRLH